MKMRGWLSVVVTAIFLVTCGGRATAGSEPASGDGSGAPASERQWGEGLNQELLEGFDWRFKVVGFGLLRELENWRFNPDNFLEISRYRAELDLRPDLSLRFRRIELSVKPRLAVTWDRWEDGFKDGDSDTDVDPYVNEWLGRLMLHESLFVSYGRENLQWGPSSLISPSNPFIKDNGKNNPEVEVPGLDYARAVWIPSSEFSISFIANTDEGRADFFEPFEKRYALKLDYTGDRKYFSLIPVSTGSGDFQVGYYGGWSATDALLLYGEGSFKDNGDAAVLVGESYTLRVGPTISLEYYHNGSGCTKPLQECFAPFGTHSPDEVLVRENYVLAQFAHTRIRDAWNLIVRWIHDIDDTSNMTVGILEYELGNHAKLFTIGNYFHGDEGSEFGSLLNYSVMLGGEYNF